MLTREDQMQPDEDIYRERFETCFDRHYLEIFAFAVRRIRGRESAEDVVADTFAIAWRRRDRIPAPALPWLYAIAANLIANQHRSAGRRHNLDLRLAREASVAAPGGDVADSLAGRDELAAAFAASRRPSASCCAWSPGRDFRPGTRLWWSAARRVPRGCDSIAPAAGSQGN